METSASQRKVQLVQTQIDISFDCDSLALAERMPGFHWMSCYGDYMKETAYAIKRLGIDWDVPPKTT